MTIAEAKLRLTEIVIVNAKLQDNIDAVKSVARNILEDRYLFEMHGSELMFFLTWQEDWIDGKKYVFVNNLWINSICRGASYLLKIKASLRGKIRMAYKFYWFNRRKQAMVYRS